MKVTFQFPTHRKSLGHTFLTQQKGLGDPDGFPGGSRNDWEKRCRRRNVGDVAEDRDFQSQGNISGDLLLAKPFIHCSEYARDRARQDAE